jgi:hypothetical protein
MIFWIRKLFAKPYIIGMELYNKYGCYISIDFSSSSPDEGFIDFFNKNHFLISHNMFDENWEDKIKLEQITTKLLSIYNFNPNDQNIIIVYKNHKRVYLPNGDYVSLFPGSVFVYDKSKLKISY